MTVQVEVSEQTVVDLMNAGRLDEAERLLRGLLAASTAPLHLVRLLALAVRGQGRIAEALDLQLQLVDALPGDFSSRFDLSESLLLLGDFERGWREYQWRYRMPHTSAIERKVQRPRWNGAPMPGQTLLIHDEQGFGDTLQFLRMVPAAKARSGARVVLDVMPELLSLAQRMEGIDAVTEKGTLPPAFDKHCELMSLPQVTKLTLDDLPGPVPYLTPDPKHVEIWRKRLANLPRPLVALVWAGRPTHGNDANRSMSLSDFAPLAGLGLTFLAVQKGPKAAEALTPPAGLRVEALDSHINGFEDTAAILSIADLLVSVDSSPVHLAGALGRPAWVLLPFVPDWRWLLERTDSPWYPSLRLFRQRSRGDWATVIGELGTALAALRG
ncbi:hypothetical protein GCM10007301_17920 [Azorhizobium oxalatiphilum]|uniref:Glycosyl transferase family 8 n=1 Tax=Azorhizobium oxalatiphilum TaxID=980631 RepID=A0A917BWA6_9HYPH|nr:glycosyl transferase family 8 [Azorhizobium oxalatiphilum]GGF58644.1 hypothetical protein GCM10007301_17920 [Azorhizobium oxalatiphilum]